MSANDCRESSPCDDERSSSQETSSQMSEGLPCCGSTAEDDPSRRDNFTTRDSEEPSPAQLEEAKENERQLLEHARLEQETQDREAAWRRRLASETPATSQPPPIVIGAPLGKNLTAIEAASLLVSQWEEIHERSLSETSEDSRPILEALDDARARLSMLQTSQDDPVTLSSDELSLPLNSLDAHKQASILSRIELLESSLHESSFAPEKSNMAAAISLYRSARIPYSSNWALVYAGNLVDFAPSYASFTHDRQQRLDRYSRMYGPGWFWFEPPLARTGDTSPFLASRGTWLPETDTSYDMGHYTITMSFRRMSNLVTRTRKRRRSLVDEDEPGVGCWPLPPSPEHEQPPSSSSSDPSRRFSNPPTKPRRSRNTRHPHMTPDASAPTLHFRMLLDSGATLPMLYDKDVAALGIDRASYAAVSRITVEQADASRVAMWLYEMQVAVVDTKSCASLVSASSPVWPAEERVLGGVMPVMVKPAAKPEPKVPKTQKPKTKSFAAPGGVTGPCAVTRFGSAELLKTATTVVDEAEGRDYGRLSGLLPFKVCYVQSTPGLRTMWLGEDRRDVLGAHRMPGQMRWAPGARMCDPGHPRDLWRDICGDEEEAGDPVMLDMVHERSAPRAGLASGRRKVRVTDVEKSRGRSEIVVRDDRGVEEKYIIEPRTLPSQQTRSATKGVGVGVAEGRRVRPFKKSTGS
ncbi:hypothetical protein Cob_v006362 [Colletotrichum orbiculare MAFF 240422]|uniref:Uncharacterized protein n=1 Tax=Colletotrichum orbiculare (strain 104-T / ATCC 96160 / CBS 514.97 / LARS 414 / MAFF 240422) TaxID=1213857 RepID=N4VG61_COLOR|nr:hypothetical protein Cob_v006362 [Colletotrichum orbiculare MAFF 240422]